MKLAQRLRLAGNQKGTLARAWTCNAPQFALCAIATLAPLYAQPLPSNAKSFTGQARIQHYLHRTYSWQRMSLLAADTAIDHFLDPSSEWARGPSGFTHRYCSSFGKRVASNTIEFGLGFALREDTRLRASNSAGFGNRVRYAATHAFLASTADGNTRFAYSRFAATAGGALIASTWRPRPLTASSFFEEVSFSFVGRLQDSFLTEFGPDMKRFGARIRVRLFGSGTPPLASAGRAGN
jgi:hypothetical protein